MNRLTHHPIETSDILERVKSPRAGAVVLFLGTTREWTGDRQTASLDYEAFAAMAEQKLAELEAQARKKWDIVECAIVHRLGSVPLAEASVAVAVSTPHRDDAFQAGKWLIDKLKQVVPIWKKEIWSDGNSEWVHPGMPSVQLD